MTSMWRFIVNNYVWWPLAVLESQKLPQRCRNCAATVPQAGPWERKVNQNPAAGLSKQVSVVIRAGGTKSIVFFEFSVLGWPSDVNNDTLWLVRRCSRMHVNNYVSWHSDVQRWVLRSKYEGFGVLWQLWHYWAGSACPKVCKYSCFVTLHRSMYILMFYDVFQKLSIACK